MKIAYDSQIFTEQSYGGISRYFTIISEKIVGCGADLRIFGGIYVNNYLHSLPKDIVSGLKVSRFPQKTTLLFSQYNKILTRMQISKWNPDLVHETYYSSKPASKCNVPHVATVYDMIHELFSDYFSKKDRTSSLKRKTLERVDHIVSISQSTKNDLISLFDINEEKISVIHLGVDPKLSENRLGHVSVSTRPFLLYVGQRGGYKNFQTILHVLAHSPRLKKDFDLVAFGGGAFTRDEECLISQLGFGDNQVRHLHGGDQILSACYHSASVFIYPSLYEGFGLPPLEAMACSCPVVSSNTSSMPEVIGEAAEYFVPTSISGMRDAIESVVYSPSRCAELVAKGLQRTRELSWDKCAAETLELYKKLVS